jgi:hypothetical protein
MMVNYSGHSVRILGVVPVAGLLLIWGGWLVVTDDPDGGRHPVGAVVLIVAVLCVVVGAVWFRRSRRR